MMSYFITSHLQWTLCCRCSISINIAKRVEETIGQDIAVRDDKRAVNKKRKKHIKKTKAHDNVQSTQQKTAKVATKKEEFDAVRLRLRDQYLEKKVLFATQVL